jgi:putative membrane protein
MTYSSPPPPPPSGVADSRLSSIKTYMLIAWIFSILSLIGFVLAGIYYIFIFATFSALTFGYGVGFFSGIFLIYTVIFLVMAVLSFMVFMRVSKMRKAADAGDIATLKATSNMMWAIIALIFAGVIPGIMLIISDGPIKQL